MGSAMTTCARPRNRHTQTGEISVMRQITHEEIRSALRQGACAMQFRPGEEAVLPGGQVTFVGSIVDAVIRVAAGLGPRDYGNVRDVATYNYVTQQAGAGL